MKNCFGRVSFLLLGVGPVLCAVPATPVFRAVTIDPAVQIGYGVAVADVNGDRRPDVVLADKHQIAWFESPAWTKHVIAENLTPRDNVCVAAADLDGDGRSEIAVGAGWNPADTHESGAVFYLSPPADRTQRWEPIRLPHEPTVHRMRWVRDETKRHHLVVVPLHGRGNVPATGAGVGARVLRYTPPADPRAPWSLTPLDESMHKTHNFDPVQWDRDEAQEVLLGGLEGVVLLDGGGGGGAVRRTVLLASELGGVGEVRAGRLRSGRRFVATVEPMHGHALVVYLEPPAGGASVPWIRRVIDDSLIDAHALACGDLAGTGEDQIVVGWRAMNRPGARVGIKLFTAGDEDGAVWHPTAIDDNTVACEDLALADLDADGRLDIVASGRATKNLVIFFNQGPR